MIDNDKQEILPEIKVPELKVPERVSVADKFKGKFKGFINKLKKIFNI